MRKKSLTLTMYAVGLLLGTVPHMGFAQFGNLTGQFVLDGEIPELLRATKVTGKECPTSETFVVDTKSKGIANIVIYLKKTPHQVHRTLKKPDGKTVDFVQQNGRFEPHILLVRTGQVVRVKNKDATNHNVHVHVFQNPVVGYLIPPENQDGIPMAFHHSEPVPIPVTCDLHPHEKAYWVILNHPYAAVSNGTGKFKIKNLPSGEHELVIWHERVGYVDKAFKVQVTTNETNNLGTIKVPVSRFQ